MFQNKIVVRYRDGRVLKGQTGDFLPTRPVFHLSLLDAPPDAKPIDVLISEVKAVFFVKDFTGNPQRNDIREFPAGVPLVGRKIRVEFLDGETLVGTTQGYDASRPGFFVTPVDPDSNNERCFVVARATARVTLA